MRKIIKILFYINEKKWIFLLVISMLLVLCESYMRFPFILQRLEYKIDDDLVSILKPSQKGYNWLGNMSFKSPPIEINSDGHRGIETDWSKKIILTVGNSEAIGCGVKETEVWTSCLESLVNDKSNPNQYEVVNAAHPGHGPYKQFFRMKRVLESHAVDLIIVRVDLADRYFNPINAETLSHQIKLAGIRNNIRTYTKAMPYLYNKIKAQIISIKATTKRIFSLKKKLKQVQSFEAGRKMWEKNYYHWEAMVELANNRRIPIIFMLYDIASTEGNAVIKQNLEKSIIQTNSNYLLRLGPESFNLTPGNSEMLWKQVAASLTIGRDPHANAYQHKLIAEKIFKYLINKNLVEM